MSEDTHTTPLWVTFSSLAWHSDPVTLPGEPPSPEMLKRWTKLRELELTDRQRARRVLSRRAPNIRWPGETFVHAWRKIFGCEPPADHAVPLESWHDQGGDAVYNRMGDGAIVVLFSDGSRGISVEHGHDTER